MKESYLNLRISGRMTAVRVVRVVGTFRIMKVVKAMNAVLECKMEVD